MSNNNNSSNKSKMSGQTKDALRSFKMETAREMGVNLKEGYNGDLTSREAGSVGGQMVKNNCPVRTIILERPSRTSKSHKVDLTYQCSFMIG